MRYLGIDYGSKRVGIAISSEDGIFAFPYKILENKNQEILEEQILRILEQEKIKKIVLGESLNLQGQPNQILERAQQLGENLKKKNSALEINFEKEWLSTLEARRFQNKKQADDSAAAIILQRFLDKKNNCLKR